MQSRTIDAENPIYQAVAGLDLNELDARVLTNASRMGIELDRAHLDVVQTLVRHYQEHCRQHDCRAASPHMRYLNEQYADQGGSAYLYRLFDGLEADPRDDRESGVLTLIHRLAGLPDLAHNEDAGFGTVI